MVLGSLGALLEISAAIFTKIFGEVGAKMGPRWTQGGPSWQQVTPKMGHDASKMGSVWDVLGGSWEHFWSVLSRSLGKWPKCKTTNPLSLLVFFMLWGLPPACCLGRVVGAMLEDVGSKMVFSWLLKAMFGHLGAKIGEQERKMRQISSRL